MLAGRLDNELGRVQPDISTRSGSPLTGVNNVLLVEDDSRVADAVRGRLARSNVTLHHAATVAEGKRLLGAKQDLDVIILDRTLPDGDGATVAEHCRACGRGTPIIMVTAKDSIDERISGLARGADDYLCKPFAVEELVARIDAIMRRAGSGHLHVLRYADVELDLMKRHVRRGGKETELSARELDLLAYFMSHAEEVVTQERIFKEVWGLDGVGDSGVIRVYTNYLRNKLGRPQLIYTIRNVGYVFSETDPDDGPAAGGPRG